MSDPERPSDVFTDLSDLENKSPEELTELLKKVTSLRREKEEEARRNKPTKRGRGVLENTKKILLENPDIEMDDLYARVKALSGSCSYSVMQTVRSDFLHTLRILEEAGRLLPPSAEIMPLKKVEEEQDKEEETKSPESTKKVE